MKKSTVAKKMNPLAYKELQRSKDAMLGNRNMPTRTKRVGINAIDKLMS